MKKSKDKEKTAEKRLLHSDMKSLAMFAFLVLLACVLICCSCSSTGWVQNLLVGLGTGAVTSASVSLVFYLNDKQIKLRERLRSRMLFMKKFKTLYYNFVFAMDFERRKDETVGLETYIKNQHRWHHDYYKKMVAGSDNEEETKVRIEQLKIFMLRNSAQIRACFEYSDDWENGEYDTWQRSMLSRFHRGIIETQIALELGNSRLAFFEFTYLLEEAKKLWSGFEELKNFGLLTFTYDSDGELNVNDSKFEDKEKFFKYAKQFNEARIQNYMKCFSRQTTDDVHPS